MKATQNQYLVDNLKRLSKQTSGLYGKIKWLQTGE